MLGTRASWRDTTDFVVSAPSAPYDLLLVSGVDYAFDQNGTPRRSRTTWGYDFFGNVTRRMEVGATSDSAGDETLTTYAYVPSTVPFIVDAPHLKQVFGGSTEADPLVRATMFGYDGQPPGVPPVEGLPTETRVWVDTSSTWESMRTSFDTRGNQTELVDAAGGRTVTAYDASTSRLLKNPLRW